MRLSIARRLLFGFLLLAAMEAGLVFFGFSNLQHFSFHYRQGVKTSQKLEFVYEVLFCISGLKTPMDDYLIHGAQKEKDIFWRQFEDCKKRLRFGSEVYAKTALSDVIKKAEIAVAGIEERAEKVFSDGASVSREERIVLMEEADDIIAETQRSFYAYHEQQLDKELKDITKEGALILSRTRLAAAISFPLIIVFSIVMGFLLARSILGPVGILKNSFQHVARGGLIEPVGIRSGDEFEDLASDFNRMIERLQGTSVSKDYFNKIIQNISDMLFVINPYGAVEFVNRRALDLLGYTEDELKSMEAIEIFSKKDRYVVAWGLKGFVEESVLRDKKVYLVAKSGKEIEVYLAVRLLKDAMNDIKGLVCLARDLREVNRLLDEVVRSNAELVRQKQQLEKSVEEQLEYKRVVLSILEDTNESKNALEATFKRLQETQETLLQAEKMISLGQIAAGVAHEINNPLFVISGEAEMIEMEETLAPSVKDSVKTIREQVARVIEIIRRLLEFSRKRETNFAPIALNSLLEKSVALLKYQAKALGRIEIKTDFGAEPFSVQGDSIQLQEVFLNIMINAVQAMEEKGGTLTLRIFSEIITARARRLSDKFREGARVVCVEFADTGPGFDKETEKRIFDPFFTTKKTGTGLGLSVCAGIIENHGGAIGVASVVGEGTTFTVRLPLTKA